MHNCLLNTEYSVIIPSNRQKEAEDTAIHLMHHNIHPSILDGTDYPSFAKLINDCVASAQDEIVIICNDKARPKLSHFNEMIHLIQKGFGFVGLYGWGFFGFKKELFRRVGPLDERYIGGNYEDCDYLRRMNEADIAMIVKFDVPYNEGPSGWQKGWSQQHYMNKWIDATHDNLICTRLLPEETYSYDFGPSTHDQFLPWSQSELGSSDWFKDVKVVCKLEH